MADCNCGDIGVVETSFLHAHPGPVSHILEVALVVGARGTDIVREENCANGMLIPMDGISGSQKLDFILSPVL